MQMQGDPRWITTMKPLTCVGCNAAIRKGAKVFFFPNTQTGYCTAEACGLKQATDFEAHRQDEDGY